EVLRHECLVGDGTQLDALSGPFDISFDVGCFHCLDPDGQRAYVSEVSRLLKPGGTHLIWALDASPNGLPLTPAFVKGIFSPGFELQNARKSRRRIARSHWYWLERFRFSCSNAVAAMPDVVRALPRHEEREHRRHQLADVVERARPRGAEERLQFGERQFNRIEVGTVVRLCQIV